MPDERMPNPGPEPLGAVRRVVDLEASPEDTWDAVATPEGWEGWLGTAEVEVRPGATGSMVDDEGVRRAVEVQHASEGRLRFRWWPDDDTGSASVVELVVLPRPGGSRLVVTEHLTARAPTASVAAGRAGGARGGRATALHGASDAWAWRLGVLRCRVAALALV